MIPSDNPVESPRSLSPSTLIEMGIRRPLCLSLSLSLTTYIFIHPYQHHPNSGLPYPHKPFSRSQTSLVSFLPILMSYRRMTDQ